MPSRLRHTDFVMCDLPLYFTQSIASVNTIDVAREMFTSAIAGSTADALEVPPSSITLVTIGANRRMLLATVGITYTFDVLSSMTPAAIIKKFSDSTAGGYFLHSLKFRSGLSIDTLSTASIVYVPFVTPAANKDGKSNKEGELPLFHPSANRKFWEVNYFIFLNSNRREAVKCHYRCHRRWNYRLRSFDLVMSLLHAREAEA